MTNNEFWSSVSAIISNGFNNEDLVKLETMQSNSSTDSYYLNATHKANSMAAQREVASMLLSPYSREQKLRQINSLRQGAVSKESANELRRKRQF